MPTTTSAPEMFPTTVVGSYSRPSWLLEGLRAFRAGGLVGGDEQVVMELKDQAKLLTIKEMEDAGVDIISDGEQGRTSFYEYLTEQLTGFTMDASRPFADGSRNVSLRLATDRVEFRGEVPAAREAEFLKAHTTRPGKVAVISPNFVGDYWRAGGYYATRDSLIEDMIKVCRKEAGALVKTGIEYIQWDAPGLTRYTDPSAMSDEEARRSIRREVSILNEVTQSVSPTGRSVRAAHICWGNYRSMHQRDGPLLKILPEILDLKVEVILVELASARHEDDVDAFREHPPTGKKVAAGVIDVKTPDVEPVWLVKKRASRLLKYIDADNLMLTTDCGFAPTSSSTVIPRTSCMLKLRSMASAARELRKEYAG